MERTLSLQWCHNGCDGVSNHQPHDCLLNRLFRRRLKKHQSSASLTFMRGIHRWPMNSPHKWPVTRKMFSFDDVIMVWAWAYNLLITSLPYCADCTINIFYVMTFKTASCHTTMSVVTCGIVGCRYDNIRCHRWRQSWHLGNPPFLNQRQTENSHTFLCRRRILLIILSLDWLE